MVTAPHAPQLSDILAVLASRWKVVAAIALVGLLLGGAAYALIPSRYSATADVAVNPITTDALTSTGGNNQSVNIATEQGLVTSNRVAKAAASALAPTYRISSSDLQESMSVSTPPDSLILKISASADSARHATAAANAVAVAYLDARRDRAQDKVDAMIKTTTAQLGSAIAASGTATTESVQRPMDVQSDALAQTLVRLRTFDADPGQVVSRADEPTSPSTPGLAMLGLAGLALGLLIGIPVALLRKENDSEIATIDRLNVGGDQIVLDGTKDASRSDTWDIAAFMLNLPDDDVTEGTFTIMIDADDNDYAVAPGEELVDALARRGRRSHFVDASEINEGKIRRGWPNERKLASWAGEIIIIDTTLISSAANKVAIASRSNSVLLVRSTTDDVCALRRLVGLMSSKNVSVTLSCLFPSRSRYQAPDRVRGPEMAGSTGY